MYIIPQCAVFQCGLWFDLGQVSSWSHIEKLNFHKPCFSWVDGKGAQFAVCSATGPAGHFLLYKVTCGHMADTKAAHSNYQQFPAVCHYTFLDFAQSTLLPQVVVF